MIIIKRLIYYISICIVFIISTSYNGKYPEPEYYIVDFGDGVIHSWSRKFIYDYEGIVSLTDKRLELKYKKRKTDEINRRAAYQAYIDWESKTIIHK